MVLYKNKNIVVQYLGFNSIKKPIVIKENDIKLKLDFELDRSSIDLDEVNVTGEKETRQTINSYSSIKVTQN